MSYNAKNYTEQGGAVTHIGGDLYIETDACLHVKDGGLMKADAEGVTGFLSFNEEGYMVPVTLENQAASEATTVATLKEDLNALLAKLKAAGLMDADETAPDNSGDE